MFAVRRDVGRVGMLHADDVVAGIDMMHFAGDAARQVGEQIHRRVAHLLDRHGAPQRRVVFVPLRGCSGSRRCRTAASVLIGPAEMALTRMFLLAEIGGEIAHRRLERGLGDAHDVVVRHPLLGAVIGEREQQPPFVISFSARCAIAGERIAADQHRAA